MFDNLTNRLTSTLRSIRGTGRLTENNIKDTMREIRMALLEADVALPVVKAFIDQVKEVTIELAQNIAGAVAIGDLFINYAYFVKKGTFGNCKSLSSKRY